MFASFFGFELRMWIRGAMVYVFLLILGLMVFGAASSDNIQIGGAVGNTFRNAPWVVQNFYVMMSLLSILMTTAFVNSAASRDFAYNTHQILFATPMSKVGYLLGRFCGATLVALIPQLGVTLGILIASIMPWNDAERWGPNILAAHVQGFLIFSIPNTILISSLIFAIAILTRSTLASFIGALAILVAYGIAGIFLRDLENERLAGLIDPFGIAPFRLATKYWTVSDRNTMYATLQGMILENRLIWTAVGLAILGVACRVFTFTTGSSRGGRRAAEEDGHALPAVVIPQVTLRQGGWVSIQQLLRHTKTEFFETLRSTVFIVIMVFATLNMITGLLSNATEGFGLSSLPVTYHMIDVVRGSLYIFLIAVITFYAGTLVWKERDARLDEIHDALPYPTWISYTAKCIALMGLVTVILALSIGIAVAVQAFNGYHRYQLGVYATELLAIDLVQFFALVVLAMLSHVIAPNRYLGYFLFIVLVILNIFLWRFLEVENLLFSYGQLPSYTYSDLFGFAPYVTMLVWYAIYWTAVAITLSVVAILLWQRGRETSWKFKIKQIPQRWRGGVAVVGFLALAASVVTAGWIQYNTHFLNRYVTNNESEKQRADYEKSFKKFEHLPQPRVIDVKYAIDLTPETREMVMKGTQTIVNQTREPIDQVHVTINDSYDVSLEIERAEKVAEESSDIYWVYRFKEPMQVGEKLKMTYTVETHPKGFQQALRPTEILQNGTFFNNSIAPQIGYQSAAQLTDPEDRKKYELGEVQVMPPLEKDCSSNCMNTYISNNSDWVNVETVISTSPDQIAVAPGSLIKEWTENGRRYFQYRVDHPSLNFYSFISAKYAVERKKWNGIDIEVYYHPEHAWNVPKMVSSIENSLKYYTEHFGPYMHKQARIIEFPRIAQFAQAFPGTMPYSESIGFIANLKDPEDIDMVYYVVAHEMAHQWWAHQVIGANMEGATVLSETLAQYSALMVMEKEYGRDMMRKFLQYEMDSYLTSRGRERLKERPLQKVEAGQGYVHYRKGSVVLYYIKEMIGEEKVNAALKQLVEQYAYKGPPYPTSNALIDALRLQMPEENLYLLKDLFEEITLFANRCTDAKVKKLPDGKYEVAIKVDTKKFTADPKGVETEVPVDDWIEIGAFAKPEDGKKYGATLYRQRERIKSGEREFKFVVDQLPHTAGVDPFALLIDRQPNDNMKRTEVVE